MSVSIALVAINNQVRADVEKIKLGATFIEWKVENLLEEAPAEKPAAILFGDECADVPIAEIAQLMKMHCPDIPLYFVTEKRTVIDKKLFVKNGSDDVFLLPVDLRALEYKLQDDLTKASNGQMMFLRSVSLIDIEAGEELGFDVFVHLPANNKYIRFAGASEALDPNRAERLQQKKVKSVHVKTNQMTAFYKATAKKLKSLQNNTTLSETEIKQKRESAIRSLLTDVLQAGSGDDSIENGQKLLSDCRSIVTEFVSDSNGSGGAWYQKMMSLADEKGSVYGHAANAATFAALLAIGLGLKNAEEISLAALLHDIGLADLPREVANKRITDFTPEEWDVYKTHPDLSLKIIKERKISVSDTVIKAILQHHERFDGTGYPKGIEGKRLCIEAQIVALAGYLDEWCSVKEGQPRREPLVELENLQSQILKDPSTTQFDPNLIRKVLSLFRGSAETQSTSEVA